MDFRDEINQKMAAGIDSFEAFIKEKQQVEPQYLEQMFWVEGGVYKSVLNHLIDIYQEENEHFLDFIRVLLKNIRNVNIGTPLHQAIKLGKSSLVMHLLADNDSAVHWNVHDRDMDGKTLLFFAIQAKNEAMVARLLELGASPNDAFRQEGGSALQPLHLAIMLNFSQAVTLLKQYSVQITNPTGKEMEAPVLLASRMGHIQSLEALLQGHTENIELEMTNAKGLTPVEVLCIRLHKKQNATEALKGIAILLCHGAEPPRIPLMRTLLRSNRKQLMLAAEEYLENNPNLVESFVNRCHSNGRALHNIIYSDHSWSSSIRHLFGKPGKAGVILERVVSKKYSNDSIANVVNRPREGLIDNIPDENASLKLYAEFVKLYSEAYSKQKFTNPWSTMRWKIAEGQANWDMVKSYARDYPNSRTAMIYRHIVEPVSEIRSEAEQGKPVMPN